jgi:hypothetical protein
LKAKLASYEEACVPFADPQTLCGKVQECVNSTLGIIHGRLGKGDKSLTTRDLSLKLQALWQNFSPCGYYEFTFNTPEDKKNAWYLGTYNLKPGILRFLEWDANP